MLENLNPRQFEEYCQLLLMHHYRCRVELTAQTGDEGRDLLVFHSQGLLVVECKHYPRGTVGRPIVQKLHSAILTASARTGMIVTTGKFSNEAQEYIAKLRDVNIQLIDAAKLAYLISVTFPGGPLSPQLAAAVLTTPDKDFSEAFAKSVFAPPRYKRAADAPVKVEVNRTTSYSPYFLARFSAEGSRNTAVGAIERSWSGEAWIRGDGTDAGLGVPPHGCASQDRRSSLSLVLQEAKGPVDAPKLQPHEALAQLRDFLARRLTTTETYRGRNNRTYCVAVKPSVNKVQLDSLVLCYFPHQTFCLRIGNLIYEGRLEEQGTAFHVTCPALSTCVVCGGSTSHKNQILCAVCLRPAHRWSFFSPDSYECSKCGALICRNHVGRIGRKRICKRCEPGASPLGRRWLPYFLCGILCSAVAVLLQLFLSGIPVWVPVSLFFLSWFPLVGLWVQPGLFATNTYLVYTKQSSPKSGGFPT